MNPPSHLRQLKIIAGTLASQAVYLALALACLRHWNSSDPWQRLDVFSGTFFLLSLLWSAENLYFGFSVGGSKEVTKEATGLTYDPGIIRGMVILAVLELAVFLDYGHWHLAPILEQPVLQIVGLGLYAVTPVFLFWADVHLARHFAAGPTGSPVITRGPFRWMCHPRYTGLLASRVAFSLIFSSPLGWLFAIGWLLLFLRRIRLEEAHLAAQFGDEYAAYAHGRPRLLPGLY